MTRRLMTYRHPNADHLHLLLYVGAGDGEGSDAIAVTAGDGATVTRDLEGTLREWVEIIAPWGATAAGYAEVVIVGTNIGWQHTLIHEVYRSTLDSTSDLCLASFDASHPAIGLREGRQIGYSEEAGVRGAILRSRDAWYYGLRQLVTWWPVGADLYVDSTDWTNPMPGGQTFKVRARQGWGETSRGHRGYVWTYGDAGVDEYQVRIVPSATATTSSVLTNTTGSWNDPLNGSGVGFAVNASADDELEVQLKRVSGTGRVWVGGFCVLEEYGWTEWPVS